MLKPSCITLSS